MNSLLAGIRTHALAPIIVGLFMLCIGCRSADYNARVFHPWGLENGKEAKARFHNYQHVLVACIYESHWEDRGPGRLTPFRSKATVVRSFRGNWKISERISFVHYVDAPAPPSPTANMPSGDLVFIFTNEHTDTEIALETGDFGTYDDHYAPALEHVFSRKGK